MRNFCTSEGKARTDHKCGIFWGHAGSLYHEKVMKCHAQTTDFLKLFAKESWQAVYL